MLKIYRIFSILLCLSLSQSLAQPLKSDKFSIKCVVIDPGHGGNDSGATFGGIHEKDIALNIALKFGEKIMSEFPNIKVVYTRKTDVFIPLEQRGKIANEAKGDLFVSIHINSALQKSATGTETFTLGLHKSEANLEVAMKENSVISLEDNFEKKYEGFDPNDAESYIMFSLGQYSYGMSSISYAGMIEKEFQQNIPIKSRGIKQAGFLVLWKTYMPAVLTEVGFISNTNDRKFITTKSGQEKASESLFSAFKNYKKSVEIESNYTASDNVNTKVLANAIDNAKPKLEPSKSQKVGYAVQLVASTKKIPINQATFGKHYTNVIEIKIKNVYKYYIGLVDLYDDALSLRNEISKTKYKDCFIVGINNGEVVPYGEIKKIKRKQ